MALTRKFLKELLADRDDRDELIDQIIDMHLEAIAPFREEISHWREENGGKTLEELRAELERVEAEAARLREARNAEEVDVNGTPYKTLYEQEKASFDAFKAEIEAANRRTDNVAAYRALLIENGISAKTVDKVIRACETVNRLEISNGQIKDALDISREAVKDWL